MTPAGTPRVGKKKSEPTITVKILVSIHRQASMVATYKGIDISEYLSEMLKKPVERDFKRMVAELGAKDCQAPPEQE